MILAASHFSGQHVTHRFSRVIFCSHTLPRWRSSQAPDTSTTQKPGDHIKAAFSYCVDQVKKYEYENYFWCTQLPKAARPAIFALRAFNVETGLLAQRVQQPLIAQIRLQWWRDSIKAVYARSPPNHPVCTALSHVLEAQRLTQYRLQRMLNTRDTDLGTEPPDSMKVLEEYAEGTASQLLYLQLEAAGVADSNADHAASHLGKAIGIATLLRGTPYHSSQQRCYLPRDLMTKEHVTLEELYKGVSSNRLSNVMYSVASAAQGHLEEARRRRKDVPKMVDTRNFGTN